MLFESQEVTHSSGAKILVCKDHRRQECSECELSFEEPNKENITIATLKKHTKPLGTQLGDHCLKAGAQVVRPADGGCSTVEGVIVGVCMGAFDEQHLGEPCYVLRREVGSESNLSELREVPIDDVNENWLADKKGELVPVEEVL
ncbi:MAG: hypothetical protein SGCHY_002410 [Lobulomycetales sp.]